MLISVTESMINRKVINKSYKNSITRKHNIT